MKAVRILFLLFIFVKSAYSQSDYSNIIITDTVQVNFQNNYTISRPSIVAFSEMLRIKDRVLKKNEYSINYLYGTFKLSDTLSYSIYDTVLVSYKSINLDLKRIYKNRELSIRIDEKTKDTLYISKNEQPLLSPESIFGKGIEKSGTLIRGFSVGTNKDFTLNSGLRLQLNGKISDDIEIVAALTDENTPIQPEGNTEKLDEIDKVFIQIKHPVASGTFGDFQLTKKIGEFGAVDRKLQGLLGEFSYKNNEAWVASASTKGKFNSVYITGIEGVQGPYLLYGKNNEKDIIILSGTEKIYLDGIEMKRGENNDYTIDYSNAQVTFTPKRLITSASRINVDYEYSDRRYSRNFFGAGASASLFNNAVNIKTQFLKEGDDKDSPIDVTFSDSEKQILSSSGDDIYKAVKPGEQLAALDSLGVRKGSYIKIDTTINNVLTSYFYYNPGATAAIYNVTFTYVGENKGDYIKESIGDYKFAGKGSGNYLPIILLPLPEMKEMATIMAEIRPFNKVYTSFEFSGSYYDKNRFSSIDDNDNFGSARNFVIKLEPQDVHLGGINFGNIGLSYRDRYVQSRFSSLDRYNSVEFSRDYNIADNTANEDEILREVALFYSPITKLKINGNYGYLKKGSSSKSKRINGGFTFADPQVYSVDYSIDYVQTSSLYQQSNWLKQRGNVFYKLSYFKPGFEINFEDKRDKPPLSDSLLYGSLNYTEFNPYLEFSGLKGFTASAKYSFRTDNLPVNGKFNRESNSKTQYYELTYNGIKQVSTSFSLTLRDKYYDQVFKEKGNTNTQTILIRNQTKFNFAEPANGDLFYEVSTQKTSKLERVFVKVEKGTGNYKYLGDLNNNGIADEDEFVLTLYDGEYNQTTLPSDKLYPVIDLKTGTRWKFNYGTFFSRNSLLNTICSPFSSETTIRIEENSQEEDYKKIYLLNMSAFLNEKNTIRGSNYILHDLFLLENNQELNFRFRYSQRKSLDQYSGSIERGYTRERSARIKFKMIEEINNQTDFVNSQDNIAANTQNSRVREITSNTIISDFSYRPTKNIEVGFLLKSGKNTDNYPATPTVIDVNSQTIRFTYSIANAGRIRIEVERDELITNTTKNYIPYELTGGYNLGKNYIWRANFDYRISSFLQSSATYDGRLVSGKAIHNARAEVRAYF